MTGLADLADLDAAGLLAGHASRRFTPTEAVAAVIRRIAARSTPTTPRRRRARRRPPPSAGAAAGRFARRRSGDAEGADRHTRGTPTPLGTAATLPVPAARVREAGAIILAKTTAPDLGMLSSGLSSAHPPTHNPWDLATNPGGSGGRLRATACRHRHRRPGAAAGGLVGFKPTLGRVPIDPYYVGRCAATRPPARRSACRSSRAAGPCARGLRRRKVKAGLCPDPPKARLWKPLVK